MAFRLTTPNSNCQYFESQNDIRCSNWRDFDLCQQITREEVKTHVDGDTARPGSLISICRSPRRFWNIARQHSNGGADCTVTMIDMRLMERLGIRYADTFSELGCHSKYATHYHVVVQGWIPSRCILGTISGAQFDKLYRGSGISHASQSYIHETSM